MLAEERGHEIFSQPDRWYSTLFRTLSRTLAVNIFLFFVLFSSFFLFVFFFLPRKQVKQIMHQNKCRIARLGLSDLVLKVTATARTIEKVCDQVNLALS